VLRIFDNVMRLTLVTWLLLAAPGLRAQREPDRIYRPGILSVKLNPEGRPIDYPVIRLHSADRLELRFDELGTEVRNYFYTFELCNADWTPAPLSYFDYVKGYSQVRIGTYRNSSISLTRYVHYTAVVPDRNCTPVKSGNYLLKVFLNGDTSRLAFTRRFLVVDERMDVGVQVRQPFQQATFLTHHRLQVTLAGKGVDIRYPQQQVKVQVLQNLRWDNRLRLDQPTFVRQGLLEYSNEAQMLMPAMKEWRWVNLRSFRLLGDRVSFQRNTDSSFSVFVQEEAPRPPNRYVYYRDINGMFVSETVEAVNPFWNAEYASVHFRFRPPGGQPYRGRDLFLIGEMTGYGANEGARLTFDPATGLYGTVVQLKQGYYDYCYALRDPRDPSGAFETDLTENNSWETENTYMVLVYYRELGGRYDQLLGLAQAGSVHLRTLR
jgi:hypothetical protein